jgi:hypothetical protein
MWYQLQESAPTYTHLPHSDEMTFDLSPGEYDITLTYVDTQHRPIGQRTQRVRLEHGQELELHTS